MRQLRLDNDGWAIFIGPNPQPKHDNDGVVLLAHYKLLVTISNERMKEKLDEKWVVHEDNHLIVINKPAGIATMGTEPGVPSMVNLTKLFLKEKYQKPGNVFLGVVSRIDAFVSGLLVFAKTSKSASRLVSQFQQSSVKKKYLAVLEGSLANQKGSIVSWLRKNDRLKRVESFSSKIDGGRKGELRYQVLKRKDGLTLVEIDLITGRKHQIRSQFSDLGFPVYGDQKYDARFSLGRRIALHAQSLKLEHPTLRIPMEFRSETPQIWVDHPRLSRLLTDGDRNP